MEELSGRGSRRPLGGTDEREGKVAVEGVVQKRWLQKGWYRKGGCRKSGAGKVAVEGVVQKRWMLQRSLEVTAW